MKAEDLKPRHEVMSAIIRYGASTVNRAIDGDSAYFFISEQIGLRDAEIERLRAEAAKLRTLATRRIHHKGGWTQITEESVDAYLRGEKP